jgi:ribosomal protein S27AE
MSDGKSACAPVTASRPVMEHQRSADTRHTVGPWPQCEYCVRQFIVSDDGPAPPESFRGVAYVYDNYDLLTGRVTRSYVCSKCWRRSFATLAHEVALARTSVETKERVLAELKHMIAAPEPQPCEVCGWKFSWVEGWGPRRLGPGVPYLSVPRRRLPRPRLHICSGACARERRNRRVRRDIPKCPVCGEAFLSKRSDARYCSGRCRTRAWRSRSA